LRRLTLEVSASNARARRVYARAGFLVEGVRRQVRLVDGVWDDVVDMALLSSDPRP
jgi:RimJ/RimL family protein N-acetyltransferase